MTTGRRTMLGPLVHREFRLLFAAQAISVIGSTLTPVALALGVLRATGSTTNLGLVLAAAAVPTLAMLLVGGVWADRLPRQKVIVVTHLACGLTQTSLGYLLISGRFDLGIAICLQVITGFARAFYYPAATGLTGQTVPAADLQPANALLSLTRSMAGSVGPLLAGVLVLSVGAGWALVADGMSYFLGALLLAGLRLPAQGRVPGRQPFLGQIAEGLREVLARSWVWTSIVVFMCSHLATSALMVLGPAMLATTDRGIAQWSAVVACLSAGQLAGDVLALRVHARRPIVASRLVELLAIPLPLSVAFGMTLPAMAVAAVLAGISTTYPDTLWLTAMQQHLPETSLSRVSSLDWLGSLALSPLGLVGAGAVAGLTSTASVLLTLSVLLLIAPLAGLAFKGVWQIQSIAPAAAVHQVAPVGT